MSSDSKSKGAAPAAGGPIHVVVVKEFWNTVNDVDVALQEYPLAKTVSDKTGLSCGQLALGITIAGALFVLFGFGADPLANLVGFIYPLYASFKALKTKDQDDDTQWLTYWVVYGFFTVVESFTDILLFWIPFYYFVKIIFLILCMHPKVLLANKIFVAVIKPVLNRYEDRIDETIDQGADVVTKASSTLKKRGAAAAVEHAS